MKMKKLRSTEEARKGSFDKMHEEMKYVPQMTDDEIAERIGELNFFSYCRTAGTTREDMVITLALCYAKKIIGAY